MRRILLLCFLLLMLGGCAREYGDTDEFRAFYKERTGQEMAARTETVDGITYSLEEGALRFLKEDGTELWRSDPYWFVEEFRLMDIDGDGTTDCLFSLWKSYRFYKGFDENDDPAVKCHLFLYTIRGGYAKTLWASSDLPRPILSFELEKGIPTPVSTGARLTTVEGDYSGDLRQSFSYTWKGWGFVPD